MDRLTKLAVAARDGDREALLEFVRGTQAEVWAFCASRGGRAAADDLTQDTYVRALGALPHFRADASVRTWLLAIARHASADSVRAQVRAREREARALEDDRSHLTRHEETVALTSLVENLTDDRREAFVLTQLLGLPYVDAAEVIGCPVGTIRSRVARAREDLILAMDPGRKEGRGNTAKRAAR